MEYIKRSHIEKFEYDRNHHWEKWLEINGEISEKYCNKSYLCSPYEEILFDLEYPKEDDKQVFHAANYNKNGFIPILLRGVVIDNKLDKNGDCYLQLISPEKVEKYDAKTLLDLRNLSRVENTLLLWELYSNRSQYSIGNYQDVRPGTKVIVAVSFLSIADGNKRWLTARCADIAADLDSDYTFVDESYRIHQSEREYLTLYSYLASPKRSAEKDTTQFKKILSESNNQKSVHEQTAKKSGILSQVIKWGILFLFACSLLSECTGKIRSNIYTPTVQESQSSPLYETIPTKSAATETEETIQPTTLEATVLPTEPTVVSTEATKPVDNPNLSTEETSPRTLTGAVMYSAGELNVRSGAGTNYSAIGRLKGGDVVTIYEQENVNGVMWGNIGYGWVSMQYIDLHNQNNNSSSYMQNTPSSSKTSKFLGEWVSNNKLWHMTIQQSGNGVKIDVEYCWSEVNKTTWEMYGECDEHSAIRYWDGICMEHDVHSGNIKYTSGEGAIVLNGTQLSWHESMEGSGDLMVFEKLNGRYTSPHEENSGSNNYSTQPPVQTQTPPTSTAPTLPNYANTSYQNIADMSCNEWDMRPQYAIDFFNNNADSIFRELRRIVFKKAARDISSDISESDDREISVIITSVQGTTSNTNAVIVQAKGAFEGHSYFLEAEIYWWWANSSIASEGRSFDWQ